MKYTKRDALSDAVTLFAFGLSLYTYFSVKR